MKKLTAEEMKTVKGGQETDQLRCTQHHEPCNPLRCCDPTHLCEDWGGTGLMGQICRTPWE